MFLYNVPVDMLPRRGRINHPQKGQMALMPIANTVAGVNRDAPFPLMNALAERPETGLYDGTVLTRTTSKAATRNREVPL